MLLISHFSRTATKAAISRTPTKNLRHKQKKTKTEAKQAAAAVFWYFLGGKRPPTVGQATPLATEAMLGFTVPHFIIQGSVEAWAVEVRGGYFADVFHMVKLDL